jgi:RNA polymerase-interacting CarD/CdnL/TRCF family regulator
LFAKGKHLDGKESFFLQLKPRQERRPKPKGDSMDTRTPFQPGSPVIYAMHGKCAVLGVETRQNAGETVEYYKLEVQKSPLSRSTRQEPAIWVPVSSARERGMRPPMGASDTEAVFKVIQSREYYYPLGDAWSAIQSKLEAAIRTEGATGLAKVLSYLHALKRKQIVASPEVTRMYETVSKLLIRELSEATGDSARNIEDKIAKGMRQKLIPNS